MIKIGHTTSSVQYCRDPPCSIAEGNIAMQDHQYHTFHIKSMPNLCKIRNTRHCLFIRYSVDRHNAEGLFLCRKRKIFHGQFLQIFSPLFACRNKNLTGSKPHGTFRHLLLLQLFFDPLDQRLDLLHTEGLQYVIHCLHLESGLYIIKMIIPCQEHNFAPKALFPGSLRQLYPIHHRKLYIRDHDVRFMLFQAFQRRSAVARRIHLRCAKLLPIHIIPQCFQFQLLILNQ